MKISLYTNEDWYADGRIFERLAYVRMLVQFDIAKRILYSFDIDCDIDVIVLCKENSNRSDLQFPREIAERYHLFFQPQVLEVPWNDVTRWPKADIAYMPKIWEKFPYGDNPPKWLSARTLNDIPVFLITDGAEKYYSAARLVNDRNWSANDVRALLTALVLHNTYIDTLDNAKRIVKRVNKIRKFLLDGKAPMRQKRFSPKAEPIEVLLGAFHERLCSIFDTVNIRWLVGRPIFHGVSGMLAWCISDILYHYPEAMDKHK
jgi:hypothetical protein